MKLTKGEWKVDRMARMYANKTINFDLVIQRKDNIWDNKRKSSLIHSILAGYPMPAVFASKDENVYHFLDGKQRLTSVFSYLNDEFPLSGVPVIDGIEVSGKLFSELTEDLRRRILDYPVDVHRMEEIGEDEIEELFYRLNNGVALRPIETTRAILGSRVLQFVADIAGMHFFTEKVNVSKVARQRYVDQELVLQILTLVHNRDTGFGGKEIQTFVRELRNAEIRDELRAKMQNACFYLNEAFPRKEAFLKKIHVPMLFKLVLDLQEAHAVMPPKEFGEWAKHFFDNLPEDYVEASRAGSAQREKVQRRLAIMSAAFQAYFEARRRHEPAADGAGMADGARGGGKEGQEAV